MDALMHPGGEDRKQMISGSGTKRIKQGDVTGSELDGGKVGSLHRGGMIPRLNSCLSYRVFLPTDWLSSQDNLPDAPISLLDYYEDYIKLSK